MSAHLKGITQKFPLAGAGVRRLHQNARLVAQAGGNPAMKLAVVSPD